MSGSDNAAGRQSVGSLAVYTWLVGLSVASLLISNLASTKMFDLGFAGLVMDEAVIFPVSYVLGDVIVELYGRKRAQRIIVMTVVMNLLAALVFLIVQALPPGVGWENQAAFEAILGFAPRIVLASFLAYLLGQFPMAYVSFDVIRDTKFGGRNLWWRALGSSLAGNLIDSAVFTVIAFAGVISTTQLIALVLLAFVVKMLGETLLLPVTYAVVRWLRSGAALFHRDQVSPW